MIIAVDFDGTIVEHRYPDIGREMLFAFDTLRALQKKKHQLILWTFRHGKELQEAVEYCRKNGIEFYAVNKSYPEEKFDEVSMSRKIQADLFIDDRIVGGFPGWGRIYQMIHPEENPSFENEMQSLRRKRSWFGRLFRMVVIALLCTGMLGCGKKNGVSSQRLRLESERDRLAAMVLPSADQRFTIGDSIPVSIKVPDSLKIDSMQVFLKGKKTVTVKDASIAAISSSEMGPGKTGIRVKVFFSNGDSESLSRQVTMLSELVPVEYGFRVKGEYPHDVKAYTQGLFYHDGFLFEGTGNYNQSSLRKVRLETGEVLKIRNLDGDIFGEGVTLFQNRIYQLTYKSQVGFVYDMESFEEIRKIYYQNREGWGLTHNQSELIMSDGSNVIFFIDPELFTVNRQVEVYNNRGPVDALNELEYINGRIWANRYYTDEIVIIDPASGKIEGRINLKGILSVSDRKATTDVLNGIAWDQQGKRIFVTGKYWPKLFEIEIFEK